MAASIKYRVFIILGFLVILAISGVHFASQPPNTEIGTPPSQDQLLEDYEAYIGENVGVSGTVVSRKPLSIKAEGTYGDEIELELVGMDSEAAIGDNLGVYAVVNSDGRLTVINSVHKPEQAYWRTRVLSFIAGLLVIIYGLRHWRFDRSRLTFCRRNSPLRLRTLTGGDDNA